MKKNFLHKRQFESIIPFFAQIFVFNLSFICDIFRAIQKNFVDMENMFELLQEDADVIDAPGAKPIVVTGGEVKFVNVSFGYVPEKRVLHNVNFEIPAGRTVALVSLFLLPLSYFR